MSGQAITRLTITKLIVLISFYHPKEQEKIAEILTTWDEAITKQQETNKDKRTTKKKALMQKLLSGKVRFSEFTDEWKNIQVNDFMVERNIQSPKIKNIL